MQLPAIAFYERVGYKTSASTRIDISVTKPKQNKLTPVMISNIARISKRRSQFGRLLLNLLVEI